MEINLEAAEHYSIQSYDETSITIDGIKYQNSLFVSPENLHENWPIKSLLELTAENIAPLISISPELIIIGHQELDNHIPIPILTTLSKMRIGIECMSIGAASRTFNLLLSERRNVIFGFICK